MGKERKAKSVIARKNALKRKNIGLFASEIGCVLAPFIIMCIVNREEYFIKNDALRVSASFIMLAASIVTVLCIMAKKELKLNLGSILGGLVIVDGFCFLIGKIITDLAYILLWIIIGVICAIIIDYERQKKVKEELTIIDDAIKKAKTDQYADLFKEDSQKKVKVKIKKGSD